MKLITHLSPILLAFALAAPSAEAQSPTIRASYQRSTSSPSLGVQVGLSGRRSGHARLSRRAFPSSRGYPRRESTRRVWVPGRYQLVQRSVWVPGSWRQVWVPPVYDTHYDYLGRPFQVLIAPGHYETVQTPGHWEQQNERVWCEPHWEIRS